MATFGTGATDLPVFGVVAEGLLYRSRAKVEKRLQYGRDGKVPQTSRWVAFMTFRNVNDIVLGTTNLKKNKTLVAQLYAINKKKNSVRPTYNIRALNDTSPCQRYINNPVLHEYSVETNTVFSF